MIFKNEVIRNLHEKLVKDSKPNARIDSKIVLICHTNFIVAKQLGFRETKIYMSSWSIKHLYKKRPAQEFDFLLNNIHNIVKYPDYIYKNKSNHTGNFCFVKTFNHYQYLCSVGHNRAEDNNKLIVVTAFLIKEKNYLNQYELLWSNK